jgi:hypothetical protein
MSKKLLVAGVLMSLVAVMLVAGATTTSAQTMSLCQTVDALVLAGVIAPDKVVAAKAAAGCTAAAPATAAFTRNLTIGSTGADVTALQTKLGVTPATGYFGAITKAAVVAYQTANGIVPASGYVGPLTLAKLNAGVVVVPVTPVTPVTPVVSGLNGGAGDLDVTKTSTDVESSLKEGEEGVNVLGIKAEADGSDIEVTSIKVTLMNASFTDGTSEKLTNYIDEVIIMLGDEEVGSVDADDFTKTSGTPDTFSKTISLNGAVIDENDDEKIYVAVSAASNIDSDDLAADWNVVIDTIRFTDATGAILTASLPTSVDETGEDFSFDAIDTDDKIDIKSSSANPDSETVLVEDDTVSEEILALVFKLDVDDDSADVMVTSIPVVLTVTAAGSNASSIEDIIDEVIVTIDGTDYEADLSGTGTISNGTGTATYTVDLDDDEFVIGGGDVEDVKVTLVFNEQDEEGNYAENTTVTASVNPANIDAETDEDDIVVGGITKTGATLTLNTSAASVSVTSKTSEINDNGTIGTFSFTFKVVADGESEVVFDIDDVIYEILGPATDFGTGSENLLLISGDAEDVAGTMTVEEDGTATFTLDVTINPDSGDEGVYRVRLTDVAGNSLGDDGELAGPKTLTNI